MLVQYQTLLAQSFAQITLTAIVTIGFYSQWYGKLLLERWSLTLWRVLPNDFGNLKWDSRAMFSMNERIFYDSRDVEGVTRGLNVAILDTVTKNVIDILVFDVCQSQSLTHDDHFEAAKAFKSTIESLEDGSIVLVAVSDR